ncbi:MAG: TspO/MBR family protein, partial [Bacteroidota bacterium]
TKSEINGTWFTTLLKPSFNPPNGIFFPVWTILYVLMGISIYLIWNTFKTPLRQKAFISFGCQLVLNFLWSILFFSCHFILIAIVDILLLWACIIYMITIFRRIHPVAAYLQIPYLLWITFASILNISIYFLN